MAKVTVEPVYRPEAKVVDVVPPLPLLPPRDSELTHRAAYNAKDYEAAGLYEWGSHVQPAPQELVTTEETINDTVTVHLVDGEKYKITATKRGFLKIEHTQNKVIEPPEILDDPAVSSRIQTIHNMVGKQIQSSSTLTSEKAGTHDVAVKILNARRNGEIEVTTDSQSFWDAVQYWRTPLKEIIFQIPRGYTIPNHYRPELQARVEELLRGRKGLAVYNGETEPNPDDDLKVDEAPKRKRWFGRR